MKWMERGQIGQEMIDAERARRSWPSDVRSAEPASCHAIDKRVLLIGTRSADYIRASGHSGCIQRPNTWLHPNPSLRCQIPLATRASSIHGTLETPEFQRQSREFAAAVRAVGKPVMLLVAENYNHFEI